MYEIFLEVHTPLELQQFFEVTKQFGKKFYTYVPTIRESREPHSSWIDITAIAISRDMTYILKWNIYTKQIEDMKAFQRPNNPATHSESPLYGLEPEDETTWKVLYPYNSNRNDFRNCFYWNNFHMVTDIQKDNKVLGVGNDQIL